MSLPNLTNSDDRSPDPVPRFTIAQYQRMIEEGVLTENDRVELLEGWIVPKPQEEPPHDGVLCLVQSLLLECLPDTHLLRIKSSVTLSDSEPEPDLAVVVGPRRRYMEQHPGPRDVPLVIEVAGSSLAQDRDVKQRIYARARIPIYWIVNLRDGQLEVYTSPRAGKSPCYRERKDFTAEQTIPVIIDGEELGMLSVAELLP